MSKKTAEKILVIRSDDVFGFTEAISFERARVLLPDAAGVAPSESTVRKWATAGAKTTGGKIVVLKSTKIDDIEFTRADWVEEFICDCSGGIDPPRRKASTLTAAKRRLIAEGVYGVAAREVFFGKRKGSR